MIIFLDFDGVLHSENQRDEELFCRTPLLWKIMHACPNVRVVFSTSWRTIYKFDQLIEFATYGGGEDLAHRFIGSTPDFDRDGIYGRRDLEIEKWAEDNGNPDWLAIDDIEGLFNGGHPNLFLIDGNIALTDEDAREIIEEVSR